MMDPTGHTNPGAHGVPQRARVTLAVTVAEVSRNGGTSPKRLLPHRFTDTRWSRVLRDAGRKPVRLLKDRSRVATRPAELHVTPARVHTLALVRFQFRLRSQEPPLVAANRAPRASRSAALAAASLAKHRALPPVEDDPEGHGVPRGDVDPGRHWKPWAAVQLPEQMGVVAPGTGAEVGVLPAVVDVGPLPHRPAGHRLQEEEAARPEDQVPAGHALLTVTPPTVLAGQKKPAGHGSPTGLRALARHTVPAAHGVWHEDRLASRVRLLALEAAIQAGGRSPVRLLPHRLTRAREVRDARDAGTLPCSRLLDRRSSTRAPRAPSSTGMEPVRLLLARSRPTTRPSALQVTPDRAHAGVVEFTPQPRARVQVAPPVLANTARRYSRSPTGSHRADPPLLVNPSGHLEPVLLMAPARHWKPGEARHCPGHPSIPTLSP